MNVNPENQPFELPAAGITYPEPPSALPVLPDLLDKCGVAQLLHVTPRTVENLMQAGKLPYIRITQKIVRFEKSVVLAHLRDRFSVRARGERPSVSH